MGVYIKGMEMPVFEHDSWDIRKGMDGKWYMVDTNAETTDGEWHEIVPVPPHGRLIDADALPTHPKPIGKLMMYGGEYVYTQTAIDETPTIIEAEGEDG